jgi:hypothetical protein
MSRFSYGMLLLLACSALTGCHPGPLEEYAPKEDVAVAKAYIDDLRQHRFSEIEAVADPSIQSQDLPAALPKMSAAFPSGEPKSIKIVGVNIGRSPYFSSINLTFEYEFASTWVLTNVAIQKKDGKSTIFGISAYQMADSLENTNRFTLHGKSVGAYVFLACAVLVFLLSLGALGLCIFTRGLKRKWLWILFIIFGFCTFSMNWTTGMMAFKPISIQLFGVGAFAPLYSAWTISVAMPIGAIVFLIKWFLSPPKAVEPAAPAQPGAPPADGSHPQP